MREAELLARWLDPGSLVTFHRERVRARLEHALTHSPYYRESDILCFQGTDRATVPIHPSVLGSTIAPFAKVGEYAFVSDARGRHAQIVLIPGAPADVEERLRQALVAAIGSTGAVPPAVDVQPVPALRREPGGKIRVVRAS